jgi:hypothetical protein
MQTRYQSHKGYQFSIEKTRTGGYSKRPYRMNPMFKGRVETKLDKMLQAGYIIEVKTMKGQPSCGKKTENLGSV